MRYLCSFRFASVTKSGSTSVKKEGAIASFFTGFKGFKYDSSQSASCNWRYLCTFKQWPPESRGKKDPSPQDIERKKAKSRYQRAHVEQFNSRFGVEDTLEAWQSLCSWIGIDPVPGTLKKARKLSLSATHITHGDLADCPPANLCRRSKRPTSIWWT